jgi:arylsulfatase
MLLVMGSPAAEAAKAPRHLFILSGQSNMTGGLEKGFKETVTRALGNDQVAIVRHCKPGRGIRFWIADYELPADHPSHGKLKAGNGEEFPKLIEAARSAGDPKTFDTVTFVWMQGESDANRDLGVAYERSFNTLRERIETELGIGKMRFVIARISDHGLHGKEAEGWKRMREVQQKIAEDDPLGAWIDTDDLNGGDAQNPQGELHYPGDQYPKLGERLANAALKLMSGATVTASARPAPPNIVFILADDISQEDLGCYGHPTLKTPHTDALAAKGMRFTNAYLTASSCSPSRCSIITGRYPHNTGAPELHVPLPDDQIRFPELLRQAGYYTVLAGKNHMFGTTDRAFNKITKGGKPAGSEDWVQHLKDRPKDKPFFFWFAANDAHRDWQINGDAQVYQPYQIVIPPYLVDAPATRGDLAQYYHEVSRFDHSIGLVTAELARQGVLENTMIVIAADNGRPFPRAKSRLYDSGIKTPWIVHFPKVVQQPAVSSSFISTIDLSATCLELAGIERPATIQGRSFLPILKNPENTIRDMVFAEQNWHVYSNHSRMVRFGDYLYIKNNYPDRINLCLEGHYDPAALDIWHAHAAGTTSPAQRQLFANPQPNEELFHTDKDPHQLTNLAADPSQAVALEKARGLLAAWTDQTGDTIPTNPTPDRHHPPRIENGKVIPHGKDIGAKKPHAEMPGAARNATAIQHPGPIRF